MPAKKPEPVAEVAEVEEAPAPAPAKKKAEPERWELEDEFKRLVALGNPNPARLEELKRLLAS